MTWAWRLKQNIDFINQLNPALNGFFSARLVFGKHFFKLGQKFLVVAFGPICMLIMYLLKKFQVLVVLFLNTPLAKNIF